MIGPDLERAAALRRDERAQRGLIGARPRGRRAAEVARGTASRPRPPRLRPRRGRRRRRSWSACRSARPPRARTCRARRPRSSPGRPCRSSCCRSRSRRRTGRAAPRCPRSSGPTRCRSRGASPFERRERAKARRVEPGDERHVGVVRPAAAAFGEQHDRQRAARPRARACGRASCGPCRPACRRTPCSRRRAPSRARRRSSRCRAMQAVGGARLDQLGLRSSRARCAASARPPYSAKLPGSTRSAMFSRAVRWSGLAAARDRVGRDRHRAWRRSERAARRARDGRRRWARPEDNGCVDTRVDTRACHCEATPRGHEHSAVKTRGMAAAICGRQP